MHHTIAFGLDQTGTNAKVIKYHSMLSYSGAHISWHELVLAGNHGNHQNLVPSILTYKF